ncbi:MAG: hypothetical protein H2055_06925 [Sphingopyxis sp.]|nr:hypothetical protein [Sphingopyxis sp.]
MPTVEEADQIALARAPILFRHGLGNHFPDGPGIRARFAELIAVRDAR